MHLPRFFVLSLLAMLTALFLGAAAYTLMDSNSAALHAPKARPYPKKELPTALRLTVLETGIAAVPAEQIRAANLRFNTFSADELSLTHNGRPVPFYIAEDHSTATLYFFAQAVTSTLEAPAVYWLSTGQGRPMRQRSAQPGPAVQSSVQLRYRWEENSTMVAHANNDDPWLGPLILAPDAWQLVLDTIQPDGGPGKLTIRVWSGTQGEPDPDHHLQIALNGHLLTDWFWNGIKSETISIPLSAGLLRADTVNTLTLKAPGDTGAPGEAIYVDWIEVEYQGDASLTGSQVRFQSDAANIRLHHAATPPLIFDITDKSAPVLLTDFTHHDQQVHFAGGGPGREYIALQPTQAIQPIITPVPDRPTALRRPTHAADYIAIIADHPEFAQAIQPLLAHRQQQGLRVIAVPLSQIYDEFGYGQQSPAAIRDFLAYAATQWQPPAPRFVLLVGDANYDIYDQSQGKNNNWLPAAMVATENGGFVAGDSWFTHHKAMPDGVQMAIGRFPAQNVAQLKAMVNKTIAYESINNSTWANRALLITGNEPQFNAASQALAGILERGGYQVHALRLPGNENIRYDIVSILNQGVGLVNYAGRGHEQVWGDQAVFDVTSAAMLTNGLRLSIFTTFTCRNGAFAEPDIDSLAESLLWANDGGIVAAVAPSGHSEPALQLPLPRIFYELLLSSEIPTLGEALVEAKAVVGGYTATGEMINRDVFYLYNLLGDPALRFHPSRPPTPAYP